MNKNGLNSLLLTGILILFAVVLGVIIMSINKDSSEGCDLNVGLQLTTISEEEQICFDAAKKELQFTIENGVAVEISGLVVETDGKENKIDQKIAKAGTYVGKVSVDSVDEVEIIPIIVVEGKTLTCKEERISFKSIRNC